MRKSLTYKILAAVMAAGSLGLYVAAPAAAEVVVNDNTLYANGTPIVFESGEEYGGNYTNIFGAGSGTSSRDISGGNVTINTDTDKEFNQIFGGYTGSGNVHDNHVIINSGVVSEVCGGIGESNDKDDTLTNNTVTINGGTINVVYGASSDNASIINNKVYITDCINISGIAGGTSQDNNADSNAVYIRGGSVTGDVYGGFSSKGNVEYNTVNISDNAIVRGNVSGGESYDGNAKYNTVNISGGTIGVARDITSISGGWSTSGNAHHNIVNIRGGTIGMASGITSIYGGYATDSANSANNNIVNISDGSVSGYVYGGFSYCDSANDNEIIISGSADITNANLHGYGGRVTNATGNTLTIDGWSGSTQSIENFNDINFNNINWQNDGTVLRITAGNADDLDKTTIDTIHIAGGSNINVGDKMTLIDGNISSIGDVTDTFTAGVALEGTGTTSVDNEGYVSFTVNNLKASSQAVSAAQTRAASAAFVNQGTDLISDSLDTISRDDNYGVKTFAAVHGNRSKYDVADDIKINGWSTIVGVGNADKFDNGSELSWGVFYENGSGNYRTYNSFNNEFFRGDGSMVYNGGGIAARYENKNGVYTEGSLRAGMLKNELDNAMRNVNGSYGYETESAYYGAHIGVGKIISLSDSSDLDIYGKFFHTYTEGDSVTIADDKFDFDSITSDRLRVGARITSNKENKFSTYYGLAYEYEFNGDADMTAQGLRADTQSLQGSSVMAEVGFNYQPTPDSPWSFDLNMRGYTGERQGGSFNVQATYTF